MSVHNLASYRATPFGRPSAPCTGSTDHTSSGPSAAEIRAVLCGNRGPDAFRRQLIAILHDELFDRRDDLRSSEACALSYARLRHVRRALDLRADDLLADLDKLLGLHEWTGLVDGTLTTLLTIHYNLCTGSIVQLGRGRPELDGYLGELERMDSVGVFLATELGFGNNVQAMETEANYDHERQLFRIHTPSRAAQKFMPNTAAPGIPKLAVVMARLKVSGKDCGVFPFIVRIRDEHGLCDGVRVTPLGEKPDYALDNAVTSFDQVEVPLFHWLSGEDSQIDGAGRFESKIRAKRMRFFQSMERVQVGKLCLSASVVKLASAALQMTLVYGAQRKTFGVVGGDVPILRYRSFQQPVLEAVATTYASSILLHRTKERLRADGESAGVETTRQLALCKVFCSSSAIRTLTTCRERVGAQGMFSANRIITYLIQVKGVVTAEGDNELLLIKTGRELLMGHEYAAPAETELAGVPLMESADYLVGLLRRRETRLVERLRASMKAAPRTSTMFDVWNDHVCDAIELASAHATRLAADAFLEALNGVESDDLAQLLGGLLRLFCLSELAKVSGTMLAEGLLEREFVLGLDAERRRLVAELSARAPLLADGFGIPESLLSAPIAGDFMSAYDFMTPRHESRDSSVCLIDGRGGELEGLGYEAG